MRQNNDPAILVIFGRLGDQAWRKLAPTIYNLLLERQLPERFAVIGLDRKKSSPEEFWARPRDGVKDFL